MSSSELRRGRSGRATGRAGAALPRHLKLRQTLLRAWKKTGLKAGDRIESQNEIADACDFSLATVVRTLADLEADGIITRKVGSGSYLATPPWRTDRRRIGLFYDRSVIDGGLLSREFYAPMLRHLESAVVTAGHSFTYGSFTQDDMLLSEWDALDAVLLTGLTDDFPLARVVSTAVVGLLDEDVRSRVGDTFSLDLAPAYEDLARFAAGKGCRRALYVDGLTRNCRNRARLRLFRGALRRRCPKAKLAVTTLTSGAGQDAKRRRRESGGRTLRALVEETGPDLVCGYIQNDWRSMLESTFGRSLVVVNINADSELRPAINVDMGAWVERVVARLNERIADRKLPPDAFGFPATFVGDGR